jgi:hypothetical protein
MSSAYIPIIGQIRAVLISQSIIHGISVYSEFSKMAAEIIQAIKIAAE